MSYQELSIEERVTIQFGQLQGLSMRAIARMIERSPSTVSRELRRNSAVPDRYSAGSAQAQMRQRRKVCRPARKLVPGSERFDLVVYLLRKYFSPQQIAGKLRAMELPNFEGAYVCRETIYNAIYALPVGELRKELIICLRQGKTSRRPRSGGVDHRGQIPDLVSIHVRPPEVEDRFDARPLGGRPHQRQGQCVRSRHAGGAQYGLPDAGEDARRHSDFGGRRL